MSLNDPQWGKKGGGNGPPDLDELWRNFNQKLNGLFGRKGGGGGASVQPPSMRQIGGGAGLLLAVVLAVWLASGFYIVDAKQRGVVFTFGKYHRTHQSGLALAPAVSIPVAGDRQSVLGAHGRDRLPQQRQDQGAEGIDHAHRRREHHRYPVRRAVHGEGPAGLPVQQQTARRDRACRRPRARFAR